MKDKIKDMNPRASFGHKKKLTALAFFPAASCEEFF